MKRCLWRAVDHVGEVLESFVTKRRAKKAALKFLRQSLRRHGSVETIVTDLLASYGVALKQIGAIKKREVGRRLNNRAENSHQLFRRREQAMLRFMRMRRLQKFVALHGSILNQFASRPFRSIRNARSPLGPFSRTDARLLSTIGVNSARPDQCWVGATSETFWLV